MRRALVREADRARKSATSLSALESWATSFYGGGSEVLALAQHLEPAIAALAPSADPGALAKWLAEDMHRHSRAELADLAQSGPLDVKAAVATLGDGWTRARPRAIVDALVTRIDGSPR